MTIPDHILVCIQGRQLQQCGGGGGGGDDDDDDDDEHLGLSPNSPNAPRPCRRTRCAP